MEVPLKALPVLFAAAATLGACSDRASPLEPVAASATSRSSTEAPIARREADAYTTIDVPGGTFQGPLAINDHGVIVGRYQSVRDRRTRGYRRSETGELTTIEYPGAVFTVASGINNRGDIVGHYSLPEDVRPNQQVVRHGYLLRNGVSPHLIPRAPNGPIRSGSTSAAT